MKSELVNRRSILATGAAAFAALHVPGVASAAQRAVQGGGGVAGGGGVELADGTNASFSIFGTRLTVEGTDQPLILGSVFMFAAGKMYACDAVSNYGPVEGQPDARQMTGFMTIEGAGYHPFVVDLPDVAANGFGVDIVGIQVFDSVDDATPEITSPVPMGDPIFNFEGRLTTGDIQLLELSFVE